MKIVGIIPARYASTRFPGKPLALIAGKPLIQHVVERCQQASTLSEVIVATDRHSNLGSCAEFLPRRNDPRPITPAAQIALPKSRLVANAMPSSISRVMSP